MSEDHNPLPPTRGEGQGQAVPTINDRFAEAVTNQAFALTLSKAMVWALNEVVTAADAARPYFANDRAFNGLERRGLVVVTTRSGRTVSPEVGWASGANPIVLVWLPTLAGRLVLELCRQAGLQPNQATDALVHVMQQRQAELAKQEAEAIADQERRSAEFMASIKLKPEYVWTPPHPPEGHSHEG